MRLLSVVLLCLCLSNAVRADEKLPHIDAILIKKKDHTLTLLHDGAPVKTYRVSIGRGEEGPKTVRGDKKTPEGHYIIDGRKADSRFHKALHVSYPNEADRLRAYRLGADPGGDVMIHGLPKGIGWLGHAHLLTDWTAGCIAVTNSEIDEIWNAVADGTPVDIKP